MTNEIIIKNVVTTKDYKTFVRFPFRLYKSCPYWVPPLIIDELTTLLPSKNPVYQNADAEFFLAFRKNKVVGRIGAMVNWLEPDNSKKRTRFGWLDMEDDIEITKALFEKVIGFARKHKLNQIEGPMGFSIFEKAGFLTYGYDQMATMNTTYNHSYYIEHLKRLGFEPNMKWVEYEIKFPGDKTNLEKLKRFSRLIKERFQLKLKSVSSTKEVLSYVDDLFKLIEDSYKDLKTYIPIQQYQIDNYKKRFLKFVCPDYIKFILNDSDKLIGFSVIIPSVEKALIKAKGKLFPFGIFYLSKALKKHDKVAMYLIGIHPEYQGKGVPSILFYEMANVFYKNGIRSLETNPELEDNLEIQQLWKKYNPRLHKKRATFVKLLN